MKNYGLDELKALEFEWARFHEEGHGGACDDQEPTLTQIGASTRAWKERSEVAERMELRKEAMAGRGGMSSNLNELILLNNNLSGCLNHNIG